MILRASIVLLRDRLLSNRLLSNRLRRRLATVAALAVITALLPAAFGQSSNLGQIDFPTSGSPEAQQHFLEGALLLHSFEFDDAREEFQKASEIDPGFALAYWGESLTHHKLLWQRHDQKAGQAALEKLASSAEARLEKAPTEREKGYLRAAEVLFFGEGDKKARFRAYADAMGQLTRQFPDDLEAASFYAVAILGTTDGERDFRTYMRAAGIVEEVFAKNPQHPGAVHYLIHSYDDPVHAPLGLRAARVYAKIAPAAAHALHMPSHIFVALGMWRETAASNVDSWAAADARVKRKGLTVKDRNYHALWWLHYTYLQQGRYREAEKQLQIMAEDVAELSVPITRRHMAAMRAAHVVETRQWDMAASAADLDLAGVRGEQAVAHWFASGMAAAKKGDIRGARQALAALQKMTAETPKAYGSQEQAGKVMDLQLQSLIAFATGGKKKALQLIQQASAAEDKMSLSYGPPSPVKPTHEQFGELLLELDRPAEARAEFERALERAPRRALSLLGLARAAAESGDAAASKNAYRELHDVWSQADEDLPELKEINGTTTD